MAPTDAQALTAWTLSDSMANGNIELCLSHNIRNLVADTSAEPGLPWLMPSVQPESPEFSETSGPWSSSTSAERNIPVQK